MMKQLCEQVIATLSGKTLATAESCTGGGIGSAITAIAGSSAVYKGGVISYQNEIKERVLGVDATALLEYGAVSEIVALQMAVGVRRVMQTDVGISVTGLAGPGGDAYGNPVGTVFIGYADESDAFVRKFCFSGDRAEVRNQAIEHALQIILEKN